MVDIKIIEKALRFLGYHDIGGPFFNGKEWCYEVQQGMSNPTWSCPIPTDLGSMLKRCRERGLWFDISPASKTFTRVNIETRSLDTRMGVRHNWEDQDRHEYCGECDELDALFITLAAAWDAQAERMAGG